MVGSSSSITDTPRSSSSNNNTNNVDSSISTNDSSISTNDSSSSNISSSLPGEEQHGLPRGDCLVCYEEIDAALYCEYRRKGDPQWHPCLFCHPCVKQLQQTQFRRYCDSVANTTCAKEQRALLGRGPPVNLFDPHAFPACGTEEIDALWLAATARETSPKLEGSLTGEAREKLWNELRAFLIQDEPTEDETNSGLAS